MEPRDPKGARAAAWLILAVLLLFSIAAPLNQFKVPPILPILMDSLGLTVSGAGMLMSVFAITGLLLALPAGLIYQKIGVRATGLIAGGSVAAGAALGALSRTSGTLLAGRVIEGIGTSLVAVLAPAIIAQWFAERHRGTAMGIWSAWVPLGSASMMLLAPALARGGSWPAVWWLGACYALVVTFVYVLAARPAPADPGGAAGGVSKAGGASGVTSRRVLGNRTIWLLAVAFGTMNAATMGSGTYLPTFLASQHGLALEQASLLAAIPTLVLIVSAPAGGLLSDRLGSRKKLYLAGLAAAGLLLPLAGFLGVAPLIATLVLQGIAIGLVPTNVFAAAVEATGDARQGGTAMAIIMVGQNAGMLLGPVIFGGLAQAAGWPAAFLGLPAIALLGFLAGWAAKVR